MLCAHVCSFWWSDCIAFLRLRKARSACPWQSAADLITGTIHEIEIQGYWMVDNAFVSSLLVDNRSMVVSRDMYFTSWEMGKLAISASASNSLTRQESHRITGWWCRTCVVFKHICPRWLSYLFQGLKPPTRSCLNTRKPGFVWKEGLPKTPMESSSYP